MNNLVFGVGTQLIPQICLITTVSVIAKIIYTVILHLDVGLDLGISDLYEISNQKNLEFEIVDPWSMVDLM